MSASGRTSSAAGSAPVLDLGCGRGELLGLLRDAGIAASGVDADADMVAFARGEGLDVEQADALAHLGKLDDGAVGAITALQLVEHLPPSALVSLLELAARKLRPGGLLLLETINPVSPRALQNYFADLTHSQPLVAETLELLVRDAGFEQIEVRWGEPGDRYARSSCRRVPVGRCSRCLARNGSCERRCSRHSTTPSRTPP